MVRARLPLAPTPATSWPPWLCEGETGWPAAGYVESGSRQAPAHPRRGEAVRRTEQGERLGTGGRVRAATTHAELTRLLAPSTDVSNSAPPRATHRGPDSRTRLGPGHPGQTHDSGHIYRPRPPRGSPGTRLPHTLAPPAPTPGEWPAPFPGTEVTRVGHGRKAALSNLVTGPGSPVPDALAPRSRSAHLHARQPRGPGARERLLREGGREGTTRRGWRGRGEKAAAPHAASGRKRSSRHP